MTMALVGPPASAADIPDTMAQRMKACVACHGPAGRATNQGFFPRIAGKPAGYLYNQLVNSATAAPERDDGVPGGPHVRGVPARDRRILRLAGPALPAAADHRRASGYARTRRAARAAGDASRGIPACSSCHGESMTGVAPSIPGLLGLPRDYILAQFGAWRNGLRRAAAPDCMGEIARRLAPEDVTAMAVWLSSQPVPHGAAPAGSLPGKPPMQCGSGPPMRGANCRSTKIVAVPVVLGAAVAALGGLAERARRGPVSDSLPTGRSLCRTGPARSLSRAAGNCAACHTARGGAAACRRQGDSDAFRHGLRDEHHAGSGDGHRPVECGSLLARHASRPVAGTVACSIRRSRIRTTRW